MKNLKFGDTVNLTDKEAKTVEELFNNLALFRDAAIYAGKQASAESKAVWDTLRENGIITPTGKYVYRDGHLVYLGEDLSNLQGKDNG